MTLFADRNIDRTVLGLTINAGQIQSLNPLFILVLAPLFSRLWLRLERQGRDLTTPAKFASGLALNGASFALIVVASAYGGRSGEIALIWLVFAYLLQTAGEMALSPIGLSMVTKLSPPKMVGVVMGLWFFAMAGGQYLAGQLSELASVTPQPDGHIDAVRSLHAYTDLFGLLAAIGFGAALLLVALREALHRRMHSAD
jgi:POT family proton-dependent oligopeptide transporter